MFHYRYHSKKHVSYVWKFFEVVNEKQARCKLCNNLYKRSGGTHNLDDHLKRKHQTSITSNQANNKTRTIQDFISVTRTDPVVTPFSDCSARKEILDKKLAMMISQDCQPYSIVEDAGFREFVHSLQPKYVLPTRKTLSNVIIPALYEECRRSVQHCLDEIKYVSLSVDGWTSISNDAYIAVTAHYIDPMWSMKSILLDCKLVTHAETSEFICTIINNIAEDWKISDKILTIVTDQAANMIKAVDLLEIRHLPCFCHNLNTTLKTAMNQKSELSNDDDRKCQDLIQKCKNVVSFVHRSAKATRLLQEAKKEDVEEGEQIPGKLVQMVIVYHLCYLIISLYF